jgi:hypothetical protein
VPTPFYHLSIAYQLIGHPRSQPGVGSLLQEHAGAFLLGNTTPDVQVISGQSRAATHFFTVPVSDRAPLPWEHFFRLYPGLALSEKIDSRNAAFLAGYLCHLQADWLWVMSIFQPIFGPSQHWENFSSRLYLHNVLRTYMDLEAIDGLPFDTAELLANTYLDNWLPFVSDTHLNEWRQFLVCQLQPGASVKTVDVFAARHGIEASEFRSVVCSETSLEDKIFTRMPRAKLTDFRQRVIELNLALLKNLF